MVSASSLLLPSSVRDFASCIGDGAACTAPSSTRTRRGSAAVQAQPSTLSVTASYRVALASSSSPPLQLRLTWAQSPLGPTLSFSPSASAWSRVGVVGVVAAARAVLGPDRGAVRPGGVAEPVSGYYVVVAVESAEVVLALGDLAAEFVKAKFEGTTQIPMAAPFARGERVVVAVSSDAAAAVTHTARARFAEGGAEHEVSVGCAPGGGGGGGGDELWVSIDGKRAVQRAAAPVELQGEPDGVRRRPARGRDVGPPRVVVPARAAGAGLGGGDAPGEERAREPPMAGGGGRRAGLLPPRRGLQVPTLTSPSSSSSTASSLPHLMMEFTKPSNQICVL
ncbi:hypothetical protein OsJ_35227 [Oryza sativa Japonica Group]|uniref:Uncharacterized protein n=1 Tax=Oryza sativa subsp. japonica TaxID=39947 RepID=B9GBW7_ORYSJ|nr:hypothetical protein OsJ_35227 [Oryza sativa Japonica Group]